MTGSETPDGDSLSHASIGDAVWRVYENPGSVRLAADVLVSSAAESNKGTMYAACSNCGCAEFSRAVGLVITFNEIIKQEAWLAQLDEGKRVSSENPLLLDEAARDLLEDVSRKEYKNLEEIRESIPAEQIVKAFNRQLVLHMFLDMAEDLRSRVEKAREEARARVVRGEFPIPDIGTGRPEEFVPRFWRLTCGDCARWTVLEPFGPLPERDRFLEWLAEGETPSVVLVRYDEDKQRPVEACALDGVELSIVSAEKTASAVSVDPLLAKAQVPSKYAVETNIGRILLEAAPARSGEPSLEWATWTWSASFPDQGVLDKWRKLKAREARAPKAQLPIVTKIGDPRAYRIRANSLLEDFVERLKPFALTIIKERGNEYRHDLWKRKWKHLKREPNVSEPQSAGELVRLYLDEYMLGRVLKDSKRYPQGLEPQDAKYLDEILDFRNRIAHRSGAFSREEFRRFHWAVETLLRKLT